MKCPHCGQEHPDNTKFCPETGQKLSMPKSCRNKECRNFGKYNLPPDAQFCSECGKSLAGAASDDANGTTVEFNVNGVPFKMIRVQGGTFTMGATPEQGDDAESDEKPTHRVTLSDYSIGETEVTQALWKAVMGSNPSNFTCDDLPVESVSWIDCQVFIHRLNRLTGKTFRLPTEAEWEYAARGGNKSKGYKYAGSNNIDDVAWYDDNSGGHPQPVKTKQPNELGLYDMSGNVWEWCEDWFEDYSSRPQTNPRGSSSGDYRVLRGGSWRNFARRCRVSYRNSYHPSRRYNNLGFRLVMVP